MEGMKAERQSKFGAIDQALHVAECACESLEDQLDILEGSERPKSVETKAEIDRSFLAVYDSITHRVNTIADRIRSAKDRLQELLI